MVSNRLKGIVTTAALGLAGLAGVAQARAFPVGSAEDKIIQEVRAEVARTSDYKWGYGIEINEEPCLDLNAPSYQTACIGKPKELTVCVRDEEWAGAIDPADVASKALCSTLIAKEDGSYTWFRLDGDNKTRSCMWGVDDRQDLNFMGLYQLQDPNGGVNNIRAGFPGEKRFIENRPSS